MQNEFIQDYLIRDKLNREIAKLHIAKKYRPTVVIILRNTAGQFLLVKSANSHQTWGFIQGGVNPDEGVISALLRELKEEVGIYGKEIGLIWYCGSNLINIVEWEQRDGFVNGKKYFYFITICDSSVTLRLQSDEVADFAWVNPKDIPSLLGSKNEEKRQLILSALDFEPAKSA